MESETIEFPNDGQSIWAGMGDYILISPDGRCHASLKYEGEPPHGDSFHTLYINGSKFPGFTWGCQFGFSACSRYFVFSWMANKFERKTVVVDVEEKRYFVLPEYIYSFRVSWPDIFGSGDKYKNIKYTFNGSEKWIVY